MHTPVVYAFVFDGFSDWELAYALPAIKESGKYAVEIISFTKDPVTSAGGLTVLPDGDDFSFEHAAMLLLPGGKLWEEEETAAIYPLVEQFYKKRIPIAAIGSGTLVLARMGLLNQVQHSSNEPDYLKTYAPAYLGEHLYRYNPVTAHRRVITANGTAPVDFARAVFSELNLMNEAELEKWFRLFEEGIWTT
jgi:putative intracellular protease/amidase